MVIEIITFFLLNPSLYSLTLMYDQGYTSFIR